MNKPIRSASGPITILHLTDPHILPRPKETLMGIDTAYYFDAVLKQAMSTADFNLCLLTGDLVHTPSFEAYDHLLSILESHGLKFTCLPGNHDDAGLMNSRLNTAQVNCNRRIILGAWQIVCLDSSVPNSNGGALPEGELDFLKMCLEQEPELFALVAVHHHCIPSGSEWMDTMMIQNAAELINILKKHPKAKALINGHIHQQVDKDMESFRILSTPSTCFQFTPKSRKFKVDTSMPGFRLIMLYEDGSIGTEVMRLPGELTELNLNRNY